MFQIQSKDPGTVDGEVGCAESLQLGGGLVSEDGIGLEAEAAGG
jgi:hypothetical protein